MGLQLYLEKERILPAPPAQEHPIMSTVTAAGRGRMVMKSVVEIGTGRIDESGESRGKVSSLKEAKQADLEINKQTKPFFPVNPREQTALPHMHTEKGSKVGEKIF